MSYFDIHITFTVTVRLMLGSEDTVCYKVTQEEKSIQLCVQKLQGIRIVCYSR